MNETNYKYVISLWLNQKNDIKLQSKLTYEYIIDKYIINDIGYINIKNLNYYDIKSLFEKLEKNNVAISTRKTIYYIIKSTIYYSYKNKNSNYIDISNIKLKLPNNNIFVLSKEEQIILEKNLKNKINIRKICILLSLYTGLRIGEICGLKWKDIDFSNKSLYIKRTIQRIKNKDSNIKTKTILIESTPKSEKSIRLIPIPDFIIDFLYKYKNNDNYYLLSNSNKLYDPKLLESFYNRTLIKCNIKHNKFHTLRHTFATRCIESNMDIKILSEILGHSQIETTLKLYVHPSYELKKRSLENLVKYMNN